MPIEFTGPLWEQVEDLRTEQGAFAGGKGEDIGASWQVSERRKYKREKAAVPSDVCHFIYHQFLRCLMLNIPAPKHTAMTTEPLLFILAEVLLLSLCSGLFFPPFPLQQLQSLSTDRGSLAEIPALHGKYLQNIISAKRWGLHDWRAKKGVCSHSRSLLGPGGFPMLCLLFSCQSAPFYLEVRLDSR